MTKNTIQPLSEQLAHRHLKPRRKAGWRALLILACLLIPSMKALAQPAVYDPFLPNQIINEAKKHIGTPYHWGGKGPNVFDCAGFVRYVYARFGYQLASSCTPQYLSGMPVHEGDLQVADLVFFGGRNASHNIGHVGIVTEVLPDGSFYFIHAARTGVRISHSSEGYYEMRYLCACRLLPDDPASAYSLPDSIALDYFTPDSNEVFAYFSEKYVEPRLNPGGPHIDTTPVAPDTLTIALTGSIMLHQPKGLFHHRPVTLPEDPNQVLLHADVAAGHLSGPILQRGARRGGRHRHQASPQDASQLMYAGFDLMSIADRNVLDLGQKGLDSTILNLDSMQITAAGIKSYCSVSFIERNGYIYGFCAFGHDAVTHYYRDDRELKTLMQGLRDTVDVLIVSLHSEDSRGIKDSIENTRAVERFARRAVDLGADIVYGHGYDHIRGLELYNSHFIAYGLGEYCSPDVESAPVIEVRILPDGTFINGRIYSLQTATASESLLENPLKEMVSVFRRHTSERSNLLISTAGVILRY